jgi:hypothetical protein
VVQVPVVKFATVMVVGLITTGTSVITKLAVGVLPNEVGTVLVPTLLPVVGTFAHAIFVLSGNVQAGDTVEPGTVTVIGELGKA